MLFIKDELVNEIKNSKYKVYSIEPLHEGVECFPCATQFEGKDTYFITSVKPENIRCDKSSGACKFYYTNEDLSEVADWFPAHVIPIGTKFVKIKKNKRPGIGSNTCIVDVSQLPAFNTDTTNEDVSVNDYKFFLTLFNEYTISQCVYDRSNFYDAKITSSKYELPSKLQNSDFLKSKDFKVINVKRNEMESVPVGLIVKESTDKYTIEYGTVYIDMNNVVSIKWN